MNDLTDVEQAARRVPVASTWRHKQSGGRYRVDGHHEGADSYESGANLAVRVEYTQLDDGEVRKAGSRYGRALTDFLEQFTQE